MTNTTIVNSRHCVKWHVLSEPFTNDITYQVVFPQSADNDQIHNHKNAFTAILITLIMTLIGTNGQHITLTLLAYHVFGAKTISIRYIMEVLINAHQMSMCIN